MEKEDYAEFVPDLVEKISNKYFFDLANLPIHKDFLEDVTRYAKLDDELDPSILVRTQPAPGLFTLGHRRILDGYVEFDDLEIIEIPVLEPGANASNSTSLHRATDKGPQKPLHKTNNLPFWPGGLDEKLPEELFSFEDVDEDPSSLFDELLTIPPGFTEGVSFETEKSKPSKINLSDVLNSDPFKDEPLKFSFKLPTALKDKEDNNSEENVVKDIEGMQEMDKLIDSETLDLSFLDKVIKIEDDSNVKAKAPINTSEWINVVDISKSVDVEFYDEIPVMAKTWPFELDTFQKRAILKLEKNESVFVAAHTSAGKTVVAEYAVALSQKHKTRAIYTSPIKALSNQKFREFSNEFKDVGLITGDNQINSEASCLIMTTEVLRLFLYNGSNIIRDLQYVIFDEIHYINDEQRGVVWEEVLILIPSHVIIIMLSATVPNTMEFADWVGRTKKKKINVISTFKRPVPLEHYLYTGNNAKTKDERFLIMDSSRKFCHDGYKKAVEAMNNRKKPSAKKNYGSWSAGLNPQQEKNIWITLIDHLNRQDKLPVVAFTLSRKRCDQNACMLTSLDLCTETERHNIHKFINDHINILKGSDRVLPQVCKVTELLKRGIGVHHAGILPILKELVEMLFQKGLVKLLFATETFSVGINMPTRTVIFDNIKKNDGKEFRNLLPSEYIQMAGRAGRRGLDSTGTVIILVKDKVYESDELQRMMLGKPTRLESKFKLTYSMILNLFKVRQLRVEDMMKRSFSEKDSQKNQSVYKERISKLKKEIVKNNDVGLERLYDQVEHFFKIRNPYWTKLFSLASIQKSLILGRIVLVHSDGVFKYGCILRVNQVVTPRTYDVFIYKPKTDVISMVNDEFSLFVNFVRRKQPIWDPLTTGYTKDYCYVTLRDIDIMEITKKVIKNIDSQKIIDDIKRREIPRFSDCPPGVSSMNVLQELSKFSHENQCISSCTSILNPLKDFKIQDIDDIEDCCKLKSIYESNVDEDVTSIDFTDRFKNVYEEKKKMKEVENLDFLLSDSSLKFLPDFNNRVDVLNKLQYISSDKIVKLKGRVASKMSNHELLVTELIFRKVITDRPSEEIASLLSCIVFKNKKCSEPELTQSLKEGIEEIKDIARVIGTAQKDAGFDEPVEQYVDNFCFGLTEVVYEWAKGLPFSEIIKLTDVHEGTIVNTIQMLDEVIRNIKDAALFDIGDPILKQKMDEASKAIRRDIVFTASLYTM